MIALWMVYCVLCALWLACVGIVAEQMLLRGRGAVRAVWVATLALSFILPAALYWRAGHAPAPVATARNLPVYEIPTAVLHAQAGLTTMPAPVVTVAPKPEPWNAVLQRADGPLTFAWIASAALLAAYIFGGAAHLASLRRTWTPTDLLGHHVLVSESTGPALVGVGSPTIVVPAWAARLDPSRLDLILRHEDEHRRAHDGRLLAAAQLALVAMPWNVALWWQLARLRAAVELDCDARVLRAADARTYGDVLLEAARPMHDWRPIGITAFAERAANLERRIRLFVRRADPRRGVRVTGAAFLGGTALAVAIAAPTPPRRAAILGRTTLASTIASSAPQTRAASSPGPTSLNAPATPTPVTAPTPITSASAPVTSASATVTTASAPPVAPAADSQRIRYFSGAVGMDSPGVRDILRKGPDINASQSGPLIVFHEPGKPSWPYTGNEISRDSALALLGGDLFSHLSLMLFFGKPNTLAAVSDWANPPRTVEAFLAKDDNPGTGDYVTNALVESVDADSQRVALGEEDLRGLLADTHLSPNADYFIDGVPTTPAGVRAALDAGRVVSIQAVKPRTLPIGDYNVSSIPPVNGAIKVTTRAHTP